MGRIIVIEDNPVFRDHVCGMLEKAGYKTRTAYDCAGARRLLEELDDGDIIVSDLRLPDGECTEVLERMREAGIRNPFVIKIPPLRECREDILPLAEFFRELANEELGRHTEGFDKEAEKELMRRMWAGNVRELKQTVRSAVLLTEGRLIGADRLEAESTVQAGSSLLLKDGNEERERIVRALAQADGNREVTAGLLGISRTTLYNKMKEYGIMQKKSEK